MPLRARVGRHAKTGGRHCQNWADDQRTVIALLNKIPTSDGGAAGGLGGRIIAGISSDALSQAILRFEERHFPGQRSGFVDPGGAMLKRMEELASRGASSPAAPQVVTVETSLDKLRRNVLDESQSYGFTAGQMVEFEPLVKMAVKHIDDLKKLGFTQLAWPVEMYGRAHLMRGLALYVNTNTLTVVFGDDYELFFIPEGRKADDRVKAPKLPQMRYGQPVDANSQVVTEKLSTLLLFQNGECLRVPPHHQTVSILATTSQHLAKKTYKHNVVELLGHP